MHTKYIFTFIPFVYENFFNTTQITHITQYVKDSLISLCVSKLCVGYIDRWIDMCIYK